MIRLFPHRGLGALWMAIAIMGCDREDRRFTEVSPSGLQDSSVSLTELRPGPEAASVHLATAYESNAWAISEGQRMYNWFNCVGCHEHGGGSIGPPLMDDKWIYGSDPDQVYATIVQGRPRGMPSFKGRIPDSEIWKIVAYVRSMSGLTRKDARSSRADEMQTTPSQSMTKPATPRQKGIPPGNEP
jgi:cytochrome c oxidase cbb3-type subunit 3